MKITIYTTSSCPFCKAEKDYLAFQGVPFEEKNVEQNRDFLQEMLDVSDKFAGVPFTIVVKDNGEVVKLKGFTKEEFDNIIMHATPPAAIPTVPADQPLSAPQVLPTEPSMVGTLTPVATPTVLPDPIMTTPSPLVADAIVSTPSTPPAPAPTPTVSTPDPLVKVMDNLASFSDQPTSTPPVIPPTNPTPIGSPNAPVGN